MFESFIGFLILLSLILVFRVPIGFAMGAVGIVGFATLQWLTF